MQLKLGNIYYLVSSTYQFRTKQYDMDEGSAVEVLCRFCDDVFLDTSGLQLRYRFARDAPIESDAWLCATHDECERAQFLL